MDTKAQQNKSDALAAFLTQMESAKDLFAWHYPSREQIKQNAELADAMAEAIRELLYHCPAPPA